MKCTEKEDQMISEFNDNDITNYPADPRKEPTLKQAS